MTLSAFNWSNDYEDTDPENWYRSEPVIAAIGTGVVMVYVETCRLGCPARLKWTYYSAGAWSDIFDVPHATSTARPSLATFDGYVYMIYASGTDQYMARFDPRFPANFTESTPIHFVSLGAAAIAPYGGKLVIVRAEPGPAAYGRLYWRTMDAAGNFSAEQPIVRAIDGSGCGSILHSPAVATESLGAFTYYEYATSTPALAPYGNCLYLAHRDGSTNTLVYNTFGGSWGTQLTIPNGPGGAPQTSALQPAMAAFGGALHMVHVGASGSYADDIGWSYLDNNGWALVLGIPNHQTHGTPSFAPLSDRLFIVHAASDPSKSYDHDQGIWYSWYTQPVRRIL